jgi:hypothetical protein
MTLPEIVEEDLKLLDRLGNCLKTLAEAQEKMEENTLLVTTDQLRSWALICAHVALWVPENLAGEAVGQESFDLDPVVRANLIEDVEKLAGMSPELQLMASGICEDLGLPLPKAIKEKIAREQAARATGQEGGAA